MSRRRRTVRRARRPTTKPRIARMPRIWANLPLKTDARFVPLPRRRLPQRNRMMRIGGRGGQAERAQRARQSTECTEHSEPPAAGRTAEHAETAESSGSRPRLGRVGKNSLSYEGLARRGRGEVSPGGGRRQDSPGQDREARPILAPNSQCPLGPSRFSGRAVSLQRGAEKAFVRRAFAQ